MAQLPDQRRILTALAAGFGAMAVAGGAQASPFEVPDLDAADAWELKVEGSMSKSDSERFVEAPVLDITAPIRPGLETSVTFGRGSLKVDGEGTKTGALDTEWAVKWEITSAADADKRISFTTEPAVIAPTGAHGLSDDTWRVEVPLIAGRDFGPVGLRAMVGYGQSLEGSPDVEIPFGVLATYAVREGLEFGVELAGDTPAAEMGRYEAIVDVGFKWEFAKGLELQGRLGRTIRSRPGDEPATEVAFFIEKAF